MLSFGEIVDVLLDYDVVFMVNEVGVCIGVGLFDIVVELFVVCCFL